MFWENIEVSGFWVVDTYCEAEEDSLWDDGLYISLGCEKGVLFEQNRLLEYRSFNVLNANR
jgi:hypothetical protein